MDLAALGFSLDTRPLEKGKKHLEELAEAAGKAEGAAEELGKSNRKAGEDAKRYGQDTKSAAEETERLAREQHKASEATRGLSGLLGGLAISFSGLMIARDAVNAIAEFSKEVATLKATIGGTAEQMSALREQAKLVGSSTSFSLAEVAKAQRVLAQAGLEAQDILRATPDVLKFAQAGDFKNLEDAAELLVDVSSQTGKTAKDFRQLSDVMVATADTSTTSAQQLAFGYKYSATLAKEMGTEFKETSAALALLTNNGIKGESAGTALRGMMMSLLNPTNEAEKLFKKLGFNLSELNPAANGLIPALSKLQEKAISMPDLAALFGTEGATAASILTKQYDKLGGMIDKIGDSAGITDRKSKVMSDNLKAAMASIASAAEAAAVEISDRIGFEEFAKNASQNISGVIGELSGLNDKAREAGTLAEEQAQKYADMGNALKAAGVIAGGFVALQLPAMFAATAIALDRAALATRGFTLALASNPFGLAVVAITSMTAAAIYYQDEIVSVGDTTATVGDAIMATWEETGGVVLQTAADILSYFSDAMSGVSASSESSTSAIQTVWYYTGGAIIEAIKMAVNYALNAFPAMQIQAEATANAISAAFMRAAQFDFSGAAKAFTDATGKGNADAVARLKQDNFAILTTNIAQNLERKKGVALAEKEVQSELKRLKASQEAFATTKKANEVKKGPTGRTDIGEDKKGKKAADEAKKLAAEQEKLNDLLQKGSGFSASYAESLALLAKYQDKIPVEEYRAAVERLILSETDAGKAAKKHAEELAKLQEQFAVDDAKRTQNLQWQAEELALQASLIGKTSTEQAYLVAAFEAEKEIRSQIIDLTQEQAKYEREGNKWAVDAIDERIAKLQDEAQARKDAAGTLAAQKAVLSGWQSVSSDIERALTDSLMRGFENGENFVDSLKNYIKNAFKSFVVKLLLQPVMGAINSIGGPIYSQMTGGQSQQGYGGSFDLGKMFSDSKSSYDSFIDTSLKSSVGQSLGFSTPLTYTDAWAAGQNVSGATVSAGAELTSLGEAASTAGQALGYLPAVMHAAEGRYISTVGSAVGQYFGGPIGSMAGAAIGGLLDDAFGFGDKKPDERRARFGYGASEALVSEGKQTGWTGQSSFGTFRTYADKWFSDSEMRPAMSAFVDSLENLDNTVADSLKLTADQTTSAIDALKAIDKEYSFGLQWGDFTQNSKAREQIAIDRYSTILDSVESGWGDFVRGFAGSFDQFPAFLQSIIQAMQQFRDAGGDVTRVFGQQVNSIKEFERFAKSGETSAAAFQRLYGVFQITNRVLESLGKSTKGANLATADLRESFVRLAGGMEQLQGYLTEYYEGFYTEAERTAVVMADLQKEFDKYGATVPKTREEWRKLMESLDLSTESGQQAAVKLYQLQGAFLSITPEIESATDAAKDFKDEITDLEQYFRDQLSAVDYSGMTEQGQQAASALDELTSKLARLSEIGGDVDLGVQAIGRYIKTEIPKLYADALAPFKQAGGRGYTDLGKNIFGLFGAAQEANKGIAEISSQEQSAIIEASTITKVIAKDVPIAIEDSIAAIKKIDFMSMADPVNELAKQAFGRDATVEERQAATDAYNWGVSIGKSLDAIVSDIVDHALRFDEALQFLGSKTKTQYEDIKIVDTEQSAAMQASAAIKKANATAELLSGFIDAVYDQVNSAFADVIKESSLIGLGDLARSARESRITLENRLQSVVETVSATAAGIALAGGVDVTAKAKSLVDAFINGGIKTGDDLASAVESVFTGAGVDSVKNQLREAALASAKLQVESSKNLIEQLITPWQDLVDQQSFNEIDLSTMRAVKARDQALKDAADLANEIGYGFEQMSGEINRGFAAQMLDITKQKLRSVTDSISKIADFQAGIDDAIFGLRVGMSGADVSRLYAQRQAEIKAQLDAAMQGDNLDEQIGLASKLRETITQRYAAEQQAQERMMSFARGLGDYLRQLRTSDKSTGSIYDRLTEAQKQFAEDVALSRGTGAEAEAARGRVTNTSDTLLDLARQFYASGEGYRQIYNSVVGGLEGLQIDTRTESERQIDAINAGNSAALRQIDELKQVRSIFDFRLSTLIGQQANYNSQLQQFTAAMLSGNDRIAQLTASLGAYTAAQIGAGQLAVEQHIGNLSQQISAQISAVNAGIATHVGNLSQQMGQINGVILQALSQHISALSSSTASQISALHQAIANTASSILAAMATHAGNLHQTVVSTGSNVNNWLSVAMGNNTQSIIGSILAEGITTRLVIGAHASALNSTISAMTTVNGSHADGLSYVPFDGYVAELHKGERVLTASENRDYSADVSRIMGGGYGGQSVAPLLSEIKALRQEVAQLRQQQSKEHQDDLRQREAIAKQSMGQAKDLQTAMIRNTALSI